MILAVDVLWFYSYSAVSTRIVGEFVRFRFRV